MAFIGVSQIRVVAGLRKNIYLGGAIILSALVLSVLIMLALCSFWGRVKLYLIN